MNGIEIRAYDPGDESAVIDLWRQCGLIMPWNNPRADIARKCADSGDLFFVGLAGGEIVATCMAGYDGHRGWIYYLAVAETWRRRGIASQLVSHAEAGLRDLGCPKINLMVRQNNDRVVAFYKSIGYGDDPVVVLSKRLLDDEKHEFC